MSNRITKANLDALTAAINYKTKSPEASWTRNKAGKLTANVGNYHLGYRYGGVRLERMDNFGGGISVFRSYGYVTKRELWGMMHAYLNGLQDAQPIK